MVAPGEVNVDVNLAVSSSSLTSRSRELVSDWRHDLLETACCIKSIR